MVNDRCNAQQKHENHVRLDQQPPGSGKQSQIELIDDRQRTQRGKCDRQERQNERQVPQNRRPRNERCGPGQGDADMTRIAPDDDIAGNACCGGWSAALWCALRKNADGLSRSRKSGELASSCNSMRRSFAIVRAARSASLNNVLTNSSKSLICDVTRNAGRKPRR